MTRVALYARYSSDNQRDASIEDQLRICREKAERKKWTIVSTYKDAGISGASMILRPGIQTLLQDAQRQQFDVVLAEALDRISRDQADVATARQVLLEFLRRGSAKLFRCFNQRRRDRIDRFEQILEHAYSVFVFI
jgi:DNA invertase Pin-like site-specific DNA recombinase